MLLLNEPNSVQQEAKQPGLVNAQVPGSMCLVYKQTKANILTLNSLTPKKCCDSGFPTYPSKSGPTLTFYDPHEKKS